MLIEIAGLVARRSTCQRKQVGAVIARDGRILTMGYAGAPSGFAHCAEAKCDLSAPCTRTVHAEANAIAYAARIGVSIEGASLYSTLAPCETCAKLIINSGIRDVVYSELYRTSNGLDLLSEAMIPTLHFK